MRKNKRFLAIVIVLFFCFGVAASAGALELGVAIQKRYDLKIDGTAEENRERFYSIASLCEFIVARRQS